MIYPICSLILLLMFLFENKTNRKIFFYLSFFVFFFMISMHSGNFPKGDYQDYVNLFLGKSSMYEVVHFFQQEKLVS
jgi:hypothetical protein